MWKKREIENYLCIKEALIRYADGIEEKDLFSQSKSQERVRIMISHIEEITFVVMMAKLIRKS